MSLLAAEFRDSTSSLCSRVLKKDIGETPKTKSARIGGVLPIDAAARPIASVGITSIHV